MGKNTISQNLYMFRHGETEWSLSGRHTGLTDLCLTENGKKQATELSDLFGKREFSHVFCSPLQRAKQTCEILGYTTQATIDEDLTEWHYGDYEGLKTAEIRKLIPDWSVFSHGCPNGESVEDIRIRADRMIAKIRQVDGDVAIVSSGHFLRALAARWLKMPVEAGQHFVLDTATLSILGYEREFPALFLWNDKPFKKI